MLPPPMSPNIAEQAGQGAEVAGSGDDCQTGGIPAPVVADVTVVPVELVEPVASVAPVLPEIAGVSCASTRAVAAPRDAATEQPPGPQAGPGIGIERRGARRSWELASAERGIRKADLATDIMNIMEQGIMVWSSDGYCEMHNTRVLSLLELVSGDLEIGTQRAVFRQRSLARREITHEIDDIAETQIRAHQPYSFDKHLPSGRVVLTNGRPMRGGGYVVTFTDVTDARAAEGALKIAQQQAEAARAQAVEVLENERARRAEAKMLTSLDEWLQSCKSLEELFAIVRRFMGRLLPGSEGELYVYSNSRDALEGMCQWNTDTLQTHIAADGCWALRRGRPYLYSPEQVSFMCDHLHGSVTDDTGDLRYICVPIMAHGDTVGLLHLRLAEQAVRDMADPLAFAVQCGEHISMAIANVKLRDELRDQSVRDALTGLYNRRYFMSAIQREISLAARSGVPLGLISFDADHFKSFNDTHGHEAGDLVLRAIGRALDEVMSGGAVACRVGGEEFAVIVPEADLAATTDFAERLRERVSSVRVRHFEGVLPRITISLGVAMFPVDGDEPRLLMRRADEALYRAKEGGRNCVRLVE